MPAKAGIQESPAQWRCLWPLDARFRGHDGEVFSPDPTQLLSGTRRDRDRPQLRLRCCDRRREVKCQGVGQRVQRCRLASALARQSNREIIVRHVIAFGYAQGMRDAATTLGEAERGLDKAAEEAIEELDAAMKRIADNYEHEPD